jgi:hypothetical protein
MQKQRQKKKKKKKKKRISGSLRMEFSEEEERAFSAGAYYSRDFQWEALRQEVESSPGFLSLDRNPKPSSVSRSLDLKGQLDFQISKSRLQSLIP